MTTNYVSIYPDTPEHKAYKSDIGKGKCPKCGSEDVHWGDDSPEDFWAGDCYSIVSQGHACGREWQECWASVLEEVIIQEPDPDLIRKEPITT